MKQITPTENILAVIEAAEKFTDTVRPLYKQLDELQQLDDEIRRLRQPRGVETSIRTIILGDASKAIASERDYLDNYISTMAREFLHLYDKLSQSERQ